VRPPARFETVVAPAAWRTIDFISDLHLTAATPHTFERFAEYLRRTPADGVIILGDLFESWVGDDARLEGFEARVTTVLKEAATRRWLGFMVGNRDFLVGGAMLETCRMHPLADPTLLQAFGQRVLVVHGDALCLGDAPYQAFRRVVRDPAWQADFLARPLAERRSMARAMRAESERRREGQPPDASADIDTSAAVALLEAADAPVLIHGHTHRPGSSELAPGRVRHVLSDWDLDDPVAARAEVLRWQPTGLVRLAPAEAMRAAA
jgi:UDP-2,3-diacylglucosamine hydrolase